MISIHEVVPLLHKNSKQDDGEYYDGTGFLIEINGRSVLVTCKHNFVASDDTLDYFIYKDIHYSIDRKSKNFVISARDQERQYVLDSWEIFEDDYAFVCLPNVEINNPICLKSTDEIIVGEKLILVTHEPKTGKQVIVSCARIEQSEKVSKYDKDGTAADFINLVHLECKEYIPGYSGGAIIHEETGCCIGFLHSGYGNRISIIKAQTIRDRYIDLKMQ
ncbi:MAG: serine protease [Bacteroidota bacterium]|nr:serine protease [Bacteroidota bacterium]